MADLKSWHKRLMTTWIAMCQKRNKNLFKGKYFPWNKRRRKRK